MNNFWRAQTVLMLLVALTSACKQKDSSNDDADTTTPQAQESHGGDRLASIFVAKGYVVYIHLTKLAESARLLSEEEMKRFDDALMTTRIDPVAGPIKDTAGDAIEARNMDDPLYPGRKVIELDRDIWERHFASDADVFRLVFHEYLWVIGLDDANYRISNRLTLGTVPDAGIGSWKPMNFQGAPSIDPSRQEETRALSAGGKIVILPSAPSVDCSVPIVPYEYDLAAGAWKALKSPPFAQTNGFAAAASGSTVVAWGGSCRDRDSGGPKYPATGAILATETGEWTVMSTTDAPEGRRSPVVASDATRVVVWGGIGSTGVLNSGSVYTVADDTWKAMSTINAPPLGPYNGVLTLEGIAATVAGKFFVWPKDRETCNATAYAYDFASDSWAAITFDQAPGYPCRWRDAVWTQERLIFLFDYPQDNEKGVGTSGVFWNPGLDEWTEINHAGAPGYRSDASVLFIDEQILVFGGWDVDGLPLNDGGIYDKVTEVWQPIRTSGAPVARAKPFSVWTGDRAVIWGGLSITGAPLKSGAIWTP